MRAQLFLAALTTVLAVNHPCGSNDPVVAVRFVFDMTDSDHDGVIDFNEGVRLQDVTNPDLPLVWRDWAALCRAVRVSSLYGMDLQAFAKTYLDPRLSQAIGSDVFADRHVICSRHTWLIGPPGSY